MTIQSKRYAASAMAGRRGSQGMTLIEVLVTLVIISVGLLGVAALQLTTVRSNYDAFVRSQAAVLAGDMLDRIRSNRAAALVATGNPYVTGFGDATPGTGTPAATDITQWKQMLSSQLPAGQGAIAIDPIRRIVTISIQWGERSVNVNDAQIMFTTSSQI